ncbi:hypothetical protein MVEN_01647800 [Mycena venus]|uniref:F-box domain-containing protein n=1 Tax=Mycena venus TaxID=2733690 RepID=A0A8H7CP16_9AGAR|nr:hypothetical protein MVEN_01647800 [Mycena venus]
MLLSLPPELLEEIGALLIREDLKALRGANKNVQAAVDPAFFAEFPISSSALSRLSESDFSFLRTIADGETPWSQHAKKLSVFPGALANVSHTETGDVNGPSDVRELFAAALGSMSSIRTVLWKVTMNEPEWVRQVICDSICAFPELENFSIGLLSEAELTATTEMPGEFVASSVCYSKTTAMSFMDDVILNTIIARLPSTRSLHIKACGCALAPQNACFGRCADADNYREVDDICHGLKRAVEGFRAEIIYSTDLYVDGNIYDLEPVASSGEDESTEEETTFSYRCRQPEWTPFMPRYGRVERRVHRFPDPEVAARYYAMATGGQ